MSLDSEHYCIQSKRIEKMDSQLGDIHEQFQVDGTIGVMSGQLARITAIAENGKPKGGAPEKAIYFIIVGLVAIIAALVGANVPI